MILNKLNNFKQYKLNHIILWLNVFSQIQNSINTLYNFFSEIAVFHSDLIPNENRAKNLNDLKNYRVIRSIGVFCKYVMNTIVVNKFITITWENKIQIDSKNRIQPSTPLIDHSCTFSCRPPKQIYICNTKFPCFIGLNRRPKVTEIR